MFTPYPVLVQAAMQAGINPTLVENRGTTDDHTNAAKLYFGDTSILVLQSASDDNCVFAKLKPVGTKMFFVTSLIKADDYHILAGIIRAVTMEKLYSAPWVAYEVVSRLEKEGETCIFDIEDAGSVTITLGAEPALKVRLMSSSCNTPTSYWYRLIDSDGKVVTGVEKETNLNTLVEGLCKAISDLYEQHKSKTKVAAKKPEPNRDGLLEFGEDADVKEVLFQIYQQIERDIDKYRMRTRFATYRYSAAEFSVIDNLLVKKYAIAVNPFTEDIVLYSKDLSEANDKYTVVLTAKKTDPYRIFALTSEVLSAEG